MFGKKNKYEGRDDDRDRLDDGYEVDVYSERNEPRHPIRAFNFGNKTYNHNGIIGIHHDQLSNITKSPGAKKKNIKLTVDIKAPKFDNNAMSIKKMKTPTANMQDIKSPISTFDDEYINRRLKFLKEHKNVNENHILSHLQTFLRKKKR